VRIASFQTPLRLFSFIFLLAPAVALADSFVKKVGDDNVVLAGAGELPPGTIFEVRDGDDLLGFLRVEGKEKGTGSNVKIMAGKASPGARVIPIERPKTRVGFLGGDEGSRVEKELTVLCPNRLVRLTKPDDLDRRRLDAVVITTAAPEKIVRQFVDQGGIAILDLATYAAWFGEKPKKIDSEQPLSIQVVAAGSATRGLAVGQTFAHFGREDNRYVCRCLPILHNVYRVLLARVPGKEAVAVEQSIGKGRLLALDLLSPNGEPGYDSGAVLKWVLPGNLLARSVRYTRALSHRVDYDDYMQLQEAVAARVKDKWVREKAGVDSGGKTIWRFRMGPADRPTLSFDGAIHSGEWLNPHLLLDFIEYLADVPGDDYKTRWLLRNFTITVIPLLSGSMRQESFSGCDLNRNFDFRWEDYTKGYGWRAGRALKLRGTAPFSEPEARAVRDHVWNNPVIARVDMHMHGIQHGAMFIAAHPLADADLTAFDAAAGVLKANVNDRFLWKGPSQLVFRRATHAGRTVPFSTNWTAYQGLWAISTELVGGADHSLQEKEIGMEGLLAFSYAVGVDFLAGKRRWLGCPRTGFARPGGCEDATALIFTDRGKQTIAYRTNRGRGKLRLPLPSGGCRLYDETEKPIRWEAGGDHCILPMGLDRCFFECGAASRRQVLDALEQASFEQTGS